MIFIQLMRIYTFEDFKCDKSHLKSKVTLPIIDLKCPILNLHWCKSIKNIKFPIFTNILSVFNTCIQ